MNITNSERCVCDPTGRCASHGEMVEGVLYTIAARLTGLRDSLGINDPLLDGLLLAYDEERENISYARADKLLASLAPQLLDICSRYPEQTNTALINDTVRRYQRMEHAKLEMQPA